MKCPKCGSESPDAVWVCSRCEYILDPSFLGEDILNEGEKADPAREIFGAGADPVILGNIDDGEVESFLTDRTGSFITGEVKPVPEPVSVPAQVYIGGGLTQIFQHDVVLKHTADAQKRRLVLSAFEGFVFDLIDGARPVSEIRKLSALAEQDLRVALAMLSDKQMIEPMPFARAPKPAQPPIDESMLSDETRELDDLPPLASPPPSQPSMLKPPPKPPPKPAPKSAPTPAAPPPPASLPFDDLEMIPLPVPAPPPPVVVQNATPVPPVPVEDDGPPVVTRPAMKVQPLATRAAPPKKSPGESMSSSPSIRAPEPEPSPAFKSRGGLSVQRASEVPATSAAPTKGPTSPENRKRAEGFYELCMKDIHDGKVARAWGYAKMAADADPNEEKYQLLVRDWNKMTGGAGVSAGTSAIAEGQRLLQMSQSAESQGEYEKAIEFMKKACELFPDSASAHNRLAVLLATRAKDFRAAYSAAFKAVELEPDNTTYRNNMMKVLAKAEDSGATQKSPKESGGLLGKFLKK